MKYLFRDRIPSERMLTAFVKESSDTHPDHHDYHPHFEFYFRRTPLAQEITLNGECLRIDTPAAVLTAPFQIHAMSPALPCEVYERHIVYFDQRLIDAVEALLPTDFFQKNSNCLFQMSQKEAYVLEKELPNVFDDALPERERVLAFALLLNRLDRLVEPDRRHCFGQIKTYIPRVLQHLYDNTEGTLSAEQIAALFHVSRAKLNRDFRASVGQSLHGAVMDLRLSLAKTMLIESDLPIGEIARKCGFSSEEYFFSFFKHATKETPLRYRRTAKENRST